MNSFLWGRNFKDIIQWNYKFQNITYKFKKRTFKNKKVIHNLFLIYSQTFKSIKKNFKKLLPLAKHVTGNSIIPTMTTKSFKKNFFLNHFLPVSQIQWDTSNLKIPVEIERWKYLQFLEPFVYRFYISSLIDGIYFSNI